MDPLDCLSQPPPSCSSGSSQIPSFQNVSQAGPSNSRSATPVIPKASQRSRSVSVFSSFSSYASRVDKYKSDKLQKDRYESALRLQSTWEALAEKYGSIPPEEDDEVDLTTGKIVKDRGRLRGLAGREFGDLEEGQDDCEFESDGDELGVWDEKSGLDDQFPVVEAETGPQWTKEDDEDLASFLRAEAARRRSQAGAESKEDEVMDESGDKLVRSGSRPRENRDRERRYPSATPTLERLVLNEQPEPRSEYGLPEGIISPASSSKAASSPAQPRRRSTSRKILEVVIPTRSRLRRSNKSLPADEAAVEASLTGLFTPPPSSPTPVAEIQQTDARSHGTRRKSPTVTLRDLFSPSSPPPRDIAPFRPSKSARSVPPPSRSAHSALLPASFCATCQVAGDERRKWADRCGGRIDLNQCPLSLPLTETQDSETASIAAGPSRLSAQPFESTLARARIQSIGPTDETLMRWSHQARHCVVCREAGGKRAEASANCPGRRQRSLCTNGKMLTLSRSAPNLSAPSPINKSESSSSRPTPTASVSGRRTSRRRLESQEDTLESAQSPSPALSPDSESGNDIENTDRARSTSTAQRAFTPAFSDFHRGTTPLPRGATPLSTARLLYTPKGRSPRRCRYCYAAGGDRTLEAHWCRGRTWAKNCPFYVLGDATPAPTPLRDMFTPARSVSGATSRHGSSGPSQSSRMPSKRRMTRDMTMDYPLPASPRLQLDSSLPLSSPPPSSPFIATNRPALALPRTPVSQDSNRDSLISTGSTKRKSILRQPSESNFSRQGSVAKRARFSLQPELPSTESYLCRPRDDDLLDDELLLESSSPAPHSNSTAQQFCPYSREMVVRAADAGVYLGARPTGRLPESLLRSIRMASDPTRAGPSKPTSLPTPPRSCPPARQQPRNDIDSARLMLPPPLPEKCYATPPLSSSSTSSRQRSRSVSLATPTPRALSTQPRVHPATAPKIRTLMAPEQAVAVEDDVLEWGLDEDVGDSAQLWRESSLIRFVQ